MAKTNTRLLTVALPVLVVGALQLGGCLRSSDAPPPGGVYRSTSAGANFDQSVSLVNSTGDIIGDIAELTIGSIHRVAQNPETIFISTGSRGVFRSTDGGANWQSVDQVLAAATGLVQLDNGVLLIGGTNADGEGIVIRSLTDGASWERVLTIPALHRQKRVPFEVIKPPPAPAVFVSSIVRDPFQPEQVYATTSTGEVLMSTQSGKLWNTHFRVQADKRDPITNRSIASIRKVIVSPHVDGELLLITTDGGMVYARGEELEGIEVPRANGAALDATFIEQFPDALLVSTNRGAQFSRDRGKTWEVFDLPISTSAPVRNSVVAVSPTNPSRIIIAIDSILYRSEDGGKTFSTLSLGLPNHVITDISINPENAAHVLLGTAPVKS